MERYREEFYHDTRPHALADCTQPYGPIHVGTAHTMLFNWLWARKQGATFILRLEDTDLQRSETRHEQTVINEMRWLGLDWQEGPDIGGPFGPYKQTQRMALYREYFERLKRMASSTPVIAHRLSWLRSALRPAVPECHTNIRARVWVYLRLSSRRKRPRDAWPAGDCASQRMRFSPTTI